MDQEINRILNTYYPDFKKQDFNKLKSVMQNHKPQFGSDYLLLHRLEKTELFVSQNVLAYFSGYSIPITKNQFWINCLKGNINYKNFIKDCILDTNYLNETFDFILTSLLDEDKLVLQQLGLTTTVLQPIKRYELFADILQTFFNKDAYKKNMFNEDNIFNICQEDDFNFINNKYYEKYGNEIYEDFVWEENCFYNIRPNDFDVNYFENILFNEKNWIKLFIISLFLQFNHTCVIDYFNPDIINTHFQFNYFPTLRTKQQCLVNDIYCLFLNNILEYNGRTRIFKMSNLFRKQIEKINGLIKLYLANNQCFLTKKTVDLFTEIFEDIYKKN